MKKHGVSRKYLLMMGLIAAVSGIWILLRTGSRPSRITYPCQQVAVLNIDSFRLALTASIVSSRKTIMALPGRLSHPVTIGLLLVSCLFLTSDYVAAPIEYFTMSVDNNIPVPLLLESQSAVSQAGSSDLFFVQNASGIEGNMDSGVSMLFELMESRGLYFFKTASHPLGLIGSDDVVLIKINCQWPYRGGTNTDLVKTLINKTVNHPDGFTGEIVIADNGQGHGSLNWWRANSYEHDQTMEDIAGMFPSFEVSTMLWDTLRYSTVLDYESADFTDGYVINSTRNLITDVMVSYPKFRTDHDTYISFKNGIWSNTSGFNADRLKVINLPVLKSHGVYGVTGCIKHYMGVVKGEVVEGTIPHEHFAIALGGLGTVMAETKFPILNILDAVWINANLVESGRYCGPDSLYSTASFTDIIGASQDPVALDYWASKNILMPAAEYRNHTEYSSLDPDYEPTSPTGPGGRRFMVESFHNYLERSMDALESAGLQVTMNLDEINVNVTSLSGTTVPTIVPSMVSREAMVRARPKSVSLAEPSGPISTFSGLRSRWMMP